MSYQGSKKNEYKKVFKDIDFEKYEYVVDVFGGSGWLSLRAKQINPNLKIILNDLDSGLFEIYKYIKNDNHKKLNETCENIVE